MEPCAPARRLAPDRVPLPVAALAGASGYAISNLLGASYLTGTAVRYRVYGTVGIELGLVLGIIATSWSAFWMAALLILGLLMLLHPAGLAAVLPVDTPCAASRWKASNTGRAP